MDMTTCSQNDGTILEWSKPTKKYKFQDFVFPVYKCVEQEKNKQNVKSTFVTLSPNVTGV